MGLRIGNSIASLARAGGTGSGIYARSDRSTELKTAQATLEERKQRQAETVQAGFGSNTVNVPTAGIRVLNRNLEEARQAVPSTEELRQLAVERVREERARTDQYTPATQPAAAEPAEMNAREMTAVEATEPAPEETREQPVRVTQRLLPQAAPQARNFATEPVQDAAYARALRETAGNGAGAERLDVRA